MLIDNGSGTQVGTYNTQIYSTRTDNTHGHVYQVQNGGSSYYTAGALQLQKRMGHGFSAQLAYTYSRPRQTDDSGPLVFNAAPISYSPADFSSDKGESPVGPKKPGNAGLDLASHARSKLYVRGAGLSQRLGSEQCW